MNHRLALALAALFLAVLPAQASDEGSWWNACATNPVPAGAVVHLTPDRPEYFIGENVLLHFTLENAGTKPFEASFGGDYRGSPRHLRFHIQATRADGIVAADPYPHAICMGGLGGPLTLKPGEQHVSSLPLMRYCQIEEPGTYAIRVAHDFGWQEGERKRPVGDIQLAFRAPTPEEAEQVVARMEALSDDSNSSWGKPSKDYADFSCLRHPAYLEPLLRRARMGEHRALEGLEEMPSSEATAALLELAGAADANLALVAALERRLPLPPEHKRFAPRVDSDPLLARRRLIARSWKPEFAPAARAVATNLLTRSDPALVALGALILRDIGTPNDAKMLFEALDRALAPLHSPRTKPDDNILDFPQPVRELVEALNMLLARGFALGDGLSGNGQILFYFLSLAGIPPPRPDSWRQNFEAHGVSGNYPLREAALCSIPVPPPPECFPYILHAIEDPDLGVARRACTLAGQSSDAQFLPPLLDIVATEHHEWLLHEATEAATQLHAGFPLLAAWADRLNEEKLCYQAFDALGTVMDFTSRSGGGRTDLPRAERLVLRRAWKEFLAIHEKEIRAGKRFATNDPAISTNLFGRARYWDLSDGTVWPPQAAE